MSRIFISYRRAENSKDALALFERLARQFGTDAVFMDVEGIALGADFQEVLDRTLDTCSAMLLLMGRDWAELKDESGARRLDDPNDFVRIEVATALGRRIPLIPVFIDGARMPKGDRLPAELSALPRRQGMPLDHINWKAQTQQLIAALERWLQPQPGGGDAPAARKPGTVFRDAPDAPEMVVIPAGLFLMGSPEGEVGQRQRRTEEGPQHLVLIAAPFAVGRFAVTFDDWDACVAAGGCSRRPSDYGWGRGRRPVVDVSWDDVRQYLGWLSATTGKGYRLLSEAEWEYAARAGTRSAYPWGDEPGTNRANFRSSGCRWSGQQTAPVGSFEPNAFGLHDMIGNVREWTQDCWNENYKGAPADGRAWESGSIHSSWRVVRGGSWDSSPEAARVACRVKFGLSVRNSNIGFRVATTL